MKSFLSDIGNSVFVVGVLALQFLVIQFIYTAVMGYLPDIWTNILVALILLIIDLRIANHNKVGSWSLFGKNEEVN